MRLVIILLIATLVATTSLATPTRLSGVRNLNSGVALVPTLNLAGQWAKVASQLLYGREATGLSPADLINALESVP